MTDYFETVACFSESDGESRYFLLRYEVFGKYDEEMKGRPEYYIPYAGIRIREISESESDELDDEELDRETIGTAVCTMKGRLIMSNFMKSSGFDPHDLCGAFSQDIGSCWSALTDPGISGNSLSDNQGNIYYVDSIDVESAYQLQNDNTRIIVVLLANILDFINDIVNEEEIIADREKKARLTQGGTCCIDTIACCPGALPDDNRMQQKQTDSEVGDLLRAAGWSECGNPRMLYKTGLDD